ncbi:hypothetical protein [Thermogemmatispora onikobensis]|uniref:hypothetical protein n=1 Tax=Thermogemmatispora onikobensis TaxID=732234 RepID=UPI0008530D59|nr:hypothetical protein [Thermogemmatispora onikobensis]
MSRSLPLLQSQSGHRRLKQAPSTLVGPLARSQSLPANRQGLLSDARHHGYALAHCHQTPGLGGPVPAFPSWWTGVPQEEGDDQERQLPL